MSRILHIIDRLAGGGPTRAVIALAKYQRESGLPHEHRILALQGPTYPVARFLARQAHADLLIEPSEDRLISEVAAADIVQLSFWNNPTLYEFLRRPLPPLRLLLWLKVLGSTAPQIITPKLVAFGDHCVVTTPGSLELPVFGSAANATFIYSPADFARLADAPPQPHPGFNVAYIGTLNFGKLHPGFVAMSAAAAIPGVRFHVCGAQPEALAEQAQGSGQSEKFVFHGFVENIKPVLQIADVFGYPFYQHTYATSEKSLQEAMWLGIPPVVFPYGGLGYLVADEQTGLVVHDEAGYTAALERLYRQPELRRRLGQQAQEFAREYFAGQRTAGQFDNLYASLLRLPKRRHIWAAPPDDTPSGWFIETLGEAGTPFAASKMGLTEEELLMADAALAAAPTMLANGEGGIQHYRNTYPQDAYLRYWSALVLIGQQRQREAREELAAAQHYGLATAHERPFVRRALV